MKRTVSLCLFAATLVAILGCYQWLVQVEIVHYTEADLAGLTCAELSVKQEEIIFSYHDASIAHYRKTGTFEEGLGLPDESVLPFVIMMKKVIRENELVSFDLTKPFLHATSTATPKCHRDFYYEVSSICATHPTMDASTAMVQAAKNLR